MKLLLGTSFGVHCTSDLEICPQIAAFDAEGKLMSNQ